MTMYVIAVVTKHHVFLYNLSSYELIQRLTLNFHLGRVVLTHNEQGLYPFMFYSDKLDVGLLNVYNMETNKNQRTILAHKSVIITIATNAVGDIVATASTFGEVIRLWSSMTGQKLCSFEKSRASILTSLSIARSSKFITACDNNNNMQIYRIPVETINDIFEQPEKPHEQDQDIHMLKQEKETPG